MAQDKPELAKDDKLTEPITSDGKTQKAKPLGKPSTDDKIKNFEEDALTKAINQCLDNLDLTDVDDITQEENYCLIGCLLHAFNLVTIFCLFTFVFHQFEFFTWNFSLYRRTLDRRWRKIAWRFSREVRQEHPIKIHRWSPKSRKRHDSHFTRIGKGQEFLWSR